MGLTSFFSDFGHEMATAILPTFLVSVGGSAALLGVIEGMADASISGMKLLSGWYSDYVGKRKPFAVIGYLLTAIGVGSFYLAFSWPYVLLSRVIAWLGRGTREPPRDALLVDSTKPEFHGRVFGFHRGMDTLGAIAGPAIAFFLVKGMVLRPIFLIALIPSVLALLTVAILVRETKKPNCERRTHFFVSMKGLPQNFRFFLIAVGVFGLGNFADSMLILRATEILSPVNGALVAGSIAILLYTIHNVFYAAFSFPIGAIADRIGDKKVLVFGYLLTGLSSVGFIFTIGNIFYLGLLFVVVGIAIAITDAMERTVAADLLPENLRGTGYGTVAAVNGIGDFASSSIVGFLWAAVSPIAGFGYGAVLCTLGAALLAATSRKNTRGCPDIATGVN
jgi:MFS family permease